MEAVGLVRGGMGGKATVAAAGAPFHIFAGVSAGLRELSRAAQSVRSRVRGGAEWGRARASAGGRRLVVGEAPAPWPSGVRRGLHCTAARLRARARLRAKARAVPAVLPVQRPAVVI